ncbi:MAG: transposase [Alicyclobacillus sp.]|nr:transposase [Alicyclobacillus sp.]
MAASGSGAGSSLPIGTTRNWTNGCIDGMQAKIQQLKRVSNGFRNRDRYLRKMLQGFLPQSSIPHLLT